MASPTLIPMSSPNPDKKHRRRSRSWKDQGKRSHQYRVVAA